MTCPSIEHAPDLALRPIAPRGKNLGREWQTKASNAMPFSVRYAPTPIAGKMRQRDAVAPFMSQVIPPAQIGGQFP